MASFEEKCCEYYNTKDFYEILAINRDATDKEIKKAYHKISLLVHPDRVDDAHKQIATEKFKILGKIHSILQDADKRKIYDETGSFDEETDSTFNWMKYWLSMFKKIEIKDIQDYEKEYIGSETERRDIKKAYVGGKGSMDKILEMVPFSNCDNEERIIGIVREMVNSGEVEKFERFFKESPIKKMRRRKKWDKEKEQAEEIDVKELEKELEANMRKRAEGFTNFLTELEDKYAPKAKRAKRAITSGRETRIKTTGRNKKFKKRKTRKHFPRSYSYFADLIPFIVSLFGYSND